MTGDVLQPRTPQRYKVFQPGTMAVGGVSHRIHFLDISEVGARLHSSEATPQVGELVSISCVMPLGQARVKWVKNAYFGVQFVATMAPTTVQAIVEAERQTAER